MIQIENLSKRYGELEVLNTMSLHIQKGSIFGLSLIHICMMKTYFYQFMGPKPPSRNPGRQNG